MATFTDIFLQRPVLSIAINIVIFSLGLLAVNFLPIRLFPAMLTPVIEISTVYPGASSETMQNQISTMIENELTGITGIDYANSQNQVGLSKIAVHMQLGANPQKALSEIIAKLANISDALPKAAYKPQIVLQDGNEDPAMILAFTSHQLPRREVAALLRKQVAPQLSTITGIAEAKVLGRQYAMRLWLDPLQMAAHQISAEEIRHAIETENTLTSAGKINGIATAFDLTTQTTLHDANAFNQITIKQNEQSKITLNDIGHAQLTDKNSDISAFYNGRPATIVMVQLLPGANPITVTEAIKAKLPLINAALPADVQGYNVVDAGRYIHKALSEVLKTLVLAALFVIIIIYLFLGSWKAMWIPVVTIPLSLLGACSLLYLCHFSINTLTLLAMVIAIGLVVDDAIVVVENIYRHMEQGSNALTAALMGAREIAVPIIAMTLTLSVVYIPIGLTYGLTGLLFKEFAFTLSLAVIISGIIALTLSPLLCATFFKRQTLTNHHLQKTLHNVFTAISQRYLAFITRTFAASRLVWISYGVLLMIMLYCLWTVPKMLAPDEDQGLLIGISNTPNYTNAQFTQRYAPDLLNILQHFPQSDGQIVVAGIPDTHHVLSFISLKEWQQRKQSAMDLRNHLQSQVDTIPGLQSMIINPASLPGSDDLQLQIVLKSMLPYPELVATSRDIINAAWASGLFAFVQSDLTFDQPNMVLALDNDKLRAYAISHQAIANALSIFLSDDRLQEFNWHEQNYLVIPKIAPRYTLIPENLLAIHVPNRHGKLFPLASFVDLKTRVGPEHRNRFQKLNAITISGMMLPEKSLATGIQFFKTLIKQNYSQIITLDYKGATREFVAQGNRMLFIFSIGFAAIYLLLAIQFESFSMPLIIILGCVPATLTAALCCLWLGFGSLNIYTQIALLTLIGLISKHGILISTFACDLQRQGITKMMALQQALLLRLRPILMTTAAMVLGVLPLLLATGAGANSRFQLGMVIITGLIFGTALTLFYLPHFYIYLATDKKEAAYVCKLPSAA